MSSHVLVNTQIFKIELYTNLVTGNY